MNDSPFHVIYVDDDPFMLKATNRVLRRLRPEWTVSLSSEPEQWSKLAHQLTPNVVISDLLMPNLKGDDLLEQVNQAYPCTIRVLLTGDMSQQTHTLSNPNIHFTLPKPFSEPEFIELLDSIDRLHAPPFSPRVRGLLAKIEQLPVLPEAVHKIRRSIQDPECDISELAKVIEREPTVSAKLIQIANSSYLGFQSKTQDVETAIARLGLDIIESVSCVMLSLKSFKKMSVQQHQLIVDKFSRLAAFSKRVAKQMRWDKQQQSDVYISAFLLSLGTLVLHENNDTELLSPRSTIHPKVPNQLLVCAYVLILWGYGVEIADTVLKMSFFGLDKHQGEVSSHACLITLCQLYLESNLDIEEKQALFEQLPKELQDAILDVEGEID